MKSQPFLAAALVLTGCGAEVSAPRQIPLTPSASVAATNGKRTPFEAFDFICPDTPDWDPGTTTVAGNMLHLRDLVTHSYEYSTNPLIAGTTTAWVDAQINTLNNAGSFSGVYEITPTALAGTGTWRGTFGAHFKGGKFEGSPLTLVDSHMILHGTGALEGLTLMFDHIVNLAFAHPAAPFPGCEFDGEKLVGVILDPRAA
jgi:hypothetical protein